MTAMGPWEGAVASCGALKLARRLFDRLRCSPGKLWWYVSMTASTTGAGACGGGCMKVAVGGIGGTGEEEREPGGQSCGVGADDDFGRIAVVKIPAGGEMLVGGASALS
jgi:hypothetical protein